MAKKTYKLFALVIILSLMVPFSAFGAAPLAPTAVTFTILHTNDFHGQLDPATGNPGLARVASVVNGVRTALGAANVLLVDAGDEMQGSLLSNLQKGKPTIAGFNAMDYDVATFGNHEFDWGQSVLNDRTGEAAYPFVSANIVKGSCDATNWTVPDEFHVVPFVIKQVSVAPHSTINVGFIGVTTTETPTITIASATAGLCFKDPADSILHYYDTVKAQADVIIVLSHLGLEDGGYGYGLPVYGDKSLAGKLNNAGKPVNMIIGGHSHTDMLTLTPPGAVKVGNTTIVQASSNGAQVGRADVTVAMDGSVSIVWSALVTKTATEDTAIKDLVNTYVTNPAYLEQVNTPIGYTAVDLPREETTPGWQLYKDNMISTFVDDAIMGYLNTDGDTSNDIDMFFNNAGGIRTNLCSIPDPENPGKYKWSTDPGDCHPGLYPDPRIPMLLTFGNMFSILPFGNATIVGTMTGAQILQVVNYVSANHGVIQPAGLKYKWYAYKDSNPGPQPYAWGAFDVCVVNKSNPAQCDPLDMDKTYKVGTNEFLAPAGQDGYTAFKYMTNITYWGDMLNAVDAYVANHYGTSETAYKGPKGDGTLDGRIVRDGTFTPDSGSIKPITILHNDDSHGNLIMSGSKVGYTNLATLIKQEKLHNPDRTLLLNGGDQIQGDAMMYYYKTSYSGFAADGTPLPDTLKTQPEIAVMNSLGYDAMTLGNHEFNFGAAVFDGIFKQTTFPILAANLTDDGAYGLSTVGPGGEGVKPYIEKTLDGIPVAIVGLTNPRVPNYELPSNIPGLHFTDPIAAANAVAPALKADGDVVIALTHIGFTSDPGSIDYDPWVDTNLAAQASGVDAILGAHSHTNPGNPGGGYKFLPTIVGGPDNTPVIVTNSRNANSILGEVVLGVRAKAGGGYEVVSRAGQYLSVTTSTPEDPATKAVAQPYVDQLATYYTQNVGQTTTPIDTRLAFYTETNGANLQADASMYELEKNGITPDFHLSGAMTNNLMADGATPDAPKTLTIADMFGGMPYENSLVVIRMNGPQLKAVLERGYRNYFYYKYFGSANPRYGGYSHYTTCMLDTNAGNQIVYTDMNPLFLPDGNNVVSMTVQGTPIDFTDADTYYNVSTVNYLAAGSCNFSDSPGTSLWPLDQIQHDTQFYVRDATIDYIKHEVTVSPAIEGRLVFNSGVIKTFLPLIANP